MTAIWQGIIIAVLAAGFLAGVKWIAQKATQRGLTARLAHWLTDNLVYIRTGFRWKAVLDVDHTSGVARVAVCKRVPASQVPDGDVFRPQQWVSGRWQKRESFAWQTYRSAIEWCARNGWSTIEFDGYRPHDAILYPGQTKWTVRLANADNQMCIVLQPGWCPIPALPEPQVKDLSLVHQLEVEVMTDSHKQQRRR